MTNDTDVDDANANLTVVESSIVATNGTAVLLADDRTIRFTPDLNKNSGNTAAFTVTYRVTDGSLTSTNTATLTITVTAVNDAPVAVNDTATTNEDTAVDKDVVTNDTDVDDANANLTVVESSIVATNGTAVLLADDRTIRFTPDLNKNSGNTAAFTVTYRVTDGSLTSTNTATLTITVTAVNDAPVLDATGSPSLSAINEDDTTSAGTLITSLISSGGSGYISDVDAGALQGLAITAADTTSGSWQYTTDGTTWLALGAVSNINARLLAADGTTRIRFVPNADFNGTIAAALTFRAWDRTSSINGSLASTTPNGGTTAFSLATDTASQTVNPVNDAPVLDATGSPSLSAINEDDTTSAGTLITSLISSGGSGYISDVDAGALQGLAITAADTTSGSWQYTTDGTTWLALGAVSNINARLLAADGTTRIRFVPNADFNGTIAAALTFRAWDRTSSINGSLASTTPNGGTTAFSLATDTASQTVNPVNDAPVLDATGSPSLSAINEDDTTSAGTLITSLISSGGSGYISDVDAGALQGLAITAADTTSGSWQYTTDGTTWLALGAVSNINARLLAADGTTRIRFVPNADFNGTIAAALTFRAWDRTSGTMAASPAPPPTAARRPSAWPPTPPRRRSTRSTTRPCSTRPAAPASTPSTRTTRPAPGPSSPASSRAVAPATSATSMPAPSRASRSPPPTRPAAAGSTRPTAPPGSRWARSRHQRPPARRGRTTRIRFVPNADFNGTIAAALTFRAWDRTSSINGSLASTTPNGGTTAFSLATDTASQTVNPVNDAPVLDATGSPSLSAINEDDTTSAGTLITSLISSGGSGYISDVDAGALQGLAITAADTTSGSWQYTTDGTTWLALGAVSNINARLLAADGTTRIRFVPNADFNGTIAAALTFRAWDRTSSINGSLASTTPNGGTTAFSLATDTASQTVNPVNDAPRNLTATPDTQMVQYSDAIATVTLTAIDIDSPATALTATTSWKKSTDAGFTTTTPLGGLTLTAAGDTSTYPRTWTLQGRALVGDGTYIVRVTFSDGSATSYKDVTINVTKEDSTLEYSGDTLKSTGSTATNSTTSLQMAGVIREAADGNLGDKLGTTSIKFTLYKFTDSTFTTPVATCTGNVTSTVAGIGSATCQVTGIGADNYVVKLELVANPYYTAPVENVVVTVVLGGTGFTTGGGWVNEPNLNSRSNFGFTVKYLRNANIQGNSLYIYRKVFATSQVINGVTLPAGQYNWIIKSNAMGGLTQSCTTTTPKVCTATFTGKNNITAVNRTTGIAYSLGGNYNFQVDVTDAAEPGSSPGAGPDKYAIRVWDTTTGTYYQLGTPAAQVVINGGNIQVRP